MRLTLDQLSSACNDAKGGFVPRAKAHLERLRSNLVAAVARLDARLKAAGPESQGWRAFLDWKTLQEQLTRDGPPDLTALDRLYAKYASGHQGLNLIWFADVRQALWRYVFTAKSIDNPKTKESYETVLDRLGGSLRGYREHPSTDRAFAIGADVGWLEDAEQAPGLIQAIRHRFSHPNLLVQVSANLIRSAIGRRVDETEPVRDVILGADIYGTGHMAGEVTAELAPSTECAEFNLVLQGTINSDTVGYKGPARVYTDALTQVTSRKRLLLGAERLRALPAETRAVTDSTIRNVRTRRGVRLIERLAWKRALAQHPEAERIGTRHAERRVSRRVDREAGELVGQVNGLLREKFRKPLFERRLFPQMLRFYSTESALKLTVLHGGRSELGSPSPPPDLPKEHDLAVRLHESMINNVTSAALAGMIIEEERLQGQLTELFGSLPEGLQPDPQSEPWGITFARYKPISVTFGDGRFAVTVRGREYAQGDNQYAGMDVTAVYEIQRTDQGFKAVRQGEIEIFPPGFEPDRDKLSGRAQALRTLLQKKFGKLFAEEVVPRDIVLTGRWQKVGRLALEHWEAADGWMVLAWRRIPPADEAASRVAATLPAP